MPTVTALTFSLLKIIKINMAIMKTTTNSAFPIFPESCRSFVPWHTEATLGRVARARKQKYVDLLSKSSVICKNVSYRRKSMAESNDHASARPSPAKSRRFQTFEKACDEKWPLVTIDEEGDTCVNMNSEVRSGSTVVK